MLKKILIIFLFLSIIISCSSSNSYASTIDNNLETLEDLTNKLFQSVKKKELEESKLLIEEISKKMTQVNFDGLTNLEGIEAISSTIINTKRSLSAINPNYDSILNYTTQLYLAIDALRHKNQPLWHRYYSVLEKDIDNIKKAYKPHDLGNFQLAIKNYQQHYNIIRPALFVSKQPYQIEELDSLLIALYRADYINIEQLINNLEEITKNLFNSDEKEVWNLYISDRLIIRISIGIGLVIFLVLSYVSWKKYRWRLK